MKAREAQPARPRVVLDNNVVLALWWFQDPQLAPLLDLVVQGRIRLVSCPLLQAELQHVMARRIALAPGNASPLTCQAQVQQAVHRWVAMETDPSLTAPAWPRCTDADDQKFIDFALGLPAHALLSRDKAVLKVRKRAAALGLQVMTPERFISLFAQGMPRA